VSAGAGPTVVIAGGGTGGHTSPGLAVAPLLRERGFALAWIGSHHGLEARRAVDSGIPFFPIATGKLRRAWAWRNVTDLTLNVPAGIAQAWRLVRHLQPRAVFATGGFVALPVVAAAALARVPIVVHEQTSVPGLANRLSALLACHIAVTFADSAGAFPASRVVVTGNPLRAELRGGTRADAVARFALDPALPLVYITGGALGAHAINRAVGEALPRLLEAAQLVHQCGDNLETGDRAWLQARRAALPSAAAARYTVVPFVADELAAIYAAASLVVARAGAGTVNECCHLGLPALYVPLPGARGDEQAANAELVRRAGGCAVIPQRALTPDALVDRIAALLADPGALKIMGERARALAIPDAAERLARLIVETASS
jgi:UDP-N-acetylglucosamine--N-acetylmuramyl-(pentapeptide) pyrophosphoryl-undecaprenol N-acetylglucosamine transferase